MNQFVASTPDPATTALVTALLRHLLTLLGGLGLGIGVYSDSALSLIAGALVGIAGVAWSLYQKYAAAKAAHAGAVQSAVAGAAMKPAA